MCTIGRSIPKRKVNAYVGGKIKEIDLEDYQKGTLILIFYPLDFTFVCPTEIHGFNQLREEFEREGATLFLVSCDSVYSHKAWCEMEQGGIFGNTLPMLADKNGALSRDLGVYVEEEGRSRRASFVVQDGLIVYEVVHADGIGRSTEEMMRVIKALKFHKKHGDVCPLDWKEQKSE